MKKIFLLLISLYSYTLIAGTGAIPSGPDIKMLKDNIRFKSANVRIMTGDTDNPTSVAKTADQGSLYIQSGTGSLFQKQDAGSTTNWQPLLIGPAGSGTDNCVSRWNGTGTPTLQDSIVCITDLGAITGGLSLNLSGLTASRAMVTDGSKNLASSAVTSTELGYVSGVTSAIQTQIDGKLSTALNDSLVFVGNAGNVATGVSMSGEASIANTGAVTLSNAAVIGKTITGFTSGPGSLLATDTLLASIQKLDGNVGTKLSSTLSNTNIFVGSAGNVATSVAMSGDVNIDNTGLTTIQAGAVNLTTDVAGVLPIANGGTNTSSVLTNDRVMTSQGGGILSSTTTATELALLNSRTYIPNVSGTNNFVGIVTGTNNITTGVVSEAEISLLNGMLSVSSGVANNDKIVTQGYVDDFVESAVAGTANQLAYFNSVNSVTNLGAATNGQLPIGSTGLAPVLSTISGTTNQVIVTNGAGSITLGSPLTSAVSYTFPAVDGASGQKLTTNGAGALSWTTSTSDNSPGLLSNIGLQISMAGSAVTVALKQSDGSTDATAGNPVKIGFRNSTITTGGFTIRTITSSLSMTIDSGATLGTTNGDIHRIYIYAIDNAGTVELASSKKKFTETELISTTILDSLADDEFTIYSDIARASVPVKLIGSFISTQTTAGTWASAASKVFVGEDFQAKQQIVFAHYTSNAGNAVTTGNRIDYEDKVKDSHNAVTTGASWVFTSPISGIATVCHKTTTAAVSASVGNTFEVELVKNGFVVISGRAHVVENTASTEHYAGDCWDIDVLDGDAIYLSVLESLPAVNYITGSTRMTVTIKVVPW